MALLDGSLFDPQNYQGILGLLQRLQAGGVPTGVSSPDQTPTGDTFARGNFGSMGGVPFPIDPGNQSAPPDNVDLSARARTPVAATLPPQIAAASPLAPPQGGSFGAGLANFATSNSLGSALANMFTGINTGQRTDPRSVLMQQQQATYTALRQALEQNGASPAQAHALAAAGTLQPEILKTIAPSLYQKPELKDTGADPISGQHSFAVYDPLKQTLTQAPITGQGGSPVTGALPPDATPQEISAFYDKQYPGSLARAEQMYRGEGTPPNSRQNKLDAAAQQLLLRIHPDWNMNEWIAKNKMVTQLSSGQPQSLGGRLNALRNALDHLANTSDAVVEKGNYDGGNALLSYPINKLASTTTAQRDAMAKIEREATTFGGERTKFLTGAEGTREDRVAFLNTLGADSAAPKQQAGTIEGEYIQLKSALMNQEQQIREQLGEDYLKKKPIVTPEVKAAMARLEQNIKKLRGESTQSAPAAPAAPSQTAPTSGVVDYRSYFGGK